MTNNMLYQVHFFYSWGLYKELEAIVPIVGSDPFKVLIAAAQAPFQYVEGASVHRVRRDYRASLAQ